MIDVRLTFGWTESPGDWGVMSAAAEHAHCNTMNSSTQLLDETNKNTVVDRWGKGKTTPIPPDTKIRAHTRGDIGDPFFTTVYVDNYLLINATLRRRHDRPNRVGLAGLGSRAAVRTGGGGRNVYLIPQEEYGLGHHDRRARVHYNMRISFPREKVDAIKTLLCKQWLLTRRKEKVREVLSMAGKLVNLTYVVRAVRYFVWRLLLLTG